MSPMKLIGSLRKQEPQAATKLNRTQGAASCIVSCLLDERPLATAPLHEASVHRPARSRVWVATFTGPAGRQLWRRTGLTDRQPALLLAKRWDAAARAERGGAARRAAKANP